MLRTTSMLIIITICILMVSTLPWFMYIHVHMLHDKPMKCEINFLGFIMVRQLWVWCTILLFFLTNLKLLQGIRNIIDKWLKYLNHIYNGTTAHNSRTSLEHTCTCTTIWTEWHPSVVLIYSYVYHVCAMFCCRSNIQSWGKYYTRGSYSCSHDQFDEA